MADRHPITALKYLRVAVTAVACVASFAAPGSIALAEEIRRCTFDGFTNTETCRITLVPVPAVSQDVGGGGGEGVRLPLRWHRFPWTCGDPLCSQPSEVCVRTNGADTEHGVNYIVWLVNSETGERLYLNTYCVFPGDPLPEPPAPPPSLPEFRESAGQLLEIDALLNPRASIGGLTGLETWLWCVDPDVVDVSVSLRGWVAAAEMTAVAYVWDVTGTSSATRTATSCGSEASPAAMWMPETMGAYEVTLSATWAGSWTLSWNGIPMGTFVLGPFDIAGAPQEYPVEEYVGVLTDGRGA